MIVLNPKEAVEYEMAACRDSLSCFIEKTFEILNPGVKYHHNWHVDCIAEYLESCSRREIKRLIINMPPRALKSVSASIAFPAWLLGREPSSKIMAASYAETLSFQHSTDCRAVIQSDWYHGCFPDTRLSPDQNEKSKFMTTKRGYRIATSVGASALGLGGQFLLVDDCHTPAQAASDDVRDSQLKWFDNTFSTRLDDKEKDVIIVIMQRLHQRDLAGYLLKGGGWEHLCLPAMFSKRQTFTIGNFSKTVEAGEYLHPERFSKKFLDNERATKGETFVSGQYLQNPVPEGGGIIKQKWFQLWPADKKLPRFQYVMQVWDTAFTEKLTGDPSGCMVVGVFFPQEEERENLEATGGGFAVMLIDWEAEHLGFPALRKKMIEMRSYRYGEQEKAVDLILVEDKASGQSVIQELKLAALPIKAFKPGRMDKMARLHSISHFIEAGLFYIPESTKRPGEFRDWALPFVNEVCSFPAAEHDEAVDCLSSSLITLSNMTFLRLDEIAEDIDEDGERNDPHTGNRINPYSQ